MNLPFARGVAGLSLVLASPFAVSASVADTSPQEAEQAEANEAPGETDKAVPTDANSPNRHVTEAADAQSPTVAEDRDEEKLICRSIRLDVSSRRKTRVCRTSDGWRQMNQQG